MLDFLDTLSCRLYNIIIFIFCVTYLIEYLATTNKIIWDDYILDIKNIIYYKLVLYTPYPITHHAYPIKSSISDLVQGDLTKLQDNLSCVYYHVYFISYEIHIIFMQSYYSIIIK